MLTIEECRETDPRLKKYSDKEMTHIRDDLYQLVQIIFTIIQKEHSSKSPDRVWAKLK